MSDKIFYPAAGAVALLLIVLSLVWPQGLGLQSPAPFGHAIELPDYYRMVKVRDARRAKEAREKEEARAKAAATSSSVAAQLR